MSLSKNSRTAGTLFLSAGIIQMLWIVGFSFMIFSSSYAMGFSLGSILLSGTLFSILAGILLKGGKKGPVPMLVVFAILGTCWQMILSFTGRFDGYPGAVNIGLVYASGEAICLLLLAMGIVFLAKREDVTMTDPDKTSEDGKDIAQGEEPESSAIVSVESTNELSSEVPAPPNDENSEDEDAPPEVANPEDEDTLQAVEDSENDALEQKKVESQDEQVIPSPPLCAEEPENEAKNLFNETPERIV